MAIYDYSGTKTFTASLIVEDRGNCAIVANGTYFIGHISFPGDYYMIIKTVAGQTTVLKWGPITDFTELPNGFGLDIKVFKFKESTIDREINLFLNDGKKGIYEAKTITMDEAFENLPKDHNFVATLERV